MATYSKLPSGAGRVQVRRKGRYIGETFLKRDDARRWATETEGRIDRGETREGRAAHLDARFGARTRAAAVLGQCDCSRSDPDAADARTHRFCRGPDGDPENIPLRPVATPREIGRLAVYLASPDGDYITGQSITIDGGLEMNWAGRLIWPSTVRPSLRNIDFQAGVS